MQKVIDEYAQGYERLLAAISGLNEEQMRFQPAPGKWSIHEIIVHMADAEVVGIHRLKKVLAEHEPMLTAYDQDAWAVRLGYDELDAEQYLQLFKLLRESFLPVLGKVTEDDWKRVGIHSEAGPLTFGQLLQKYVDHVRDHLQQIERVKAAMR
ncbi:DinB family protein [Brevibacillus sp. H7]|uniref:DinB family protein n=1 Tax=Brevibacillus sp. H7 TaxID=3349138 RepID=UPI0037FFE6AF